MKVLPRFWIAILFMAARDFDPCRMTPLDMETDGFQLPITGQANE